MADYTSNLVGHWKLDDGSGTNANDSSASNLDGTLINTPSWTTGQLGGAVDFNGSSQYIDLGTHSELQVSGDMTAAAWINADAISGTPGDGNSVLVCLTAGLQVPYNFALGESNNFGLGWTNDAGTADSWTTDGDPLSTGSWFHIAAVRSSGNVTFYVNGVAVSGAHVTGSQPVTTAGGQAAIGALGVYPAFYFDGRIDDVRLYSRALSADDVQALYLSAVDSAADSDGTATAAFGASATADARVFVLGQGSGLFTGASLADAYVSVTAAAVASWTGSALSDAYVSVAGVAAVQLVGAADIDAPAAMESASTSAASFAAESFADAAADANGEASAALTAASIADGAANAVGQASVQPLGAATADTLLAVAGGSAANLGGATTADSAVQSAGESTVDWSGQAAVDGDADIVSSGQATVLPVGASLADAAFMMAGTGTFEMQSDNDDEDGGGGGSWISAVVRRRIPQKRMGAD